MSNLRKMEQRWAKQGWTDHEEFQWRKLGFDDLIYNRMQKKPQRKPTLWDYIKISSSPWRRRRAAPSLDLL